MNLLLVPPHFRGLSWNERRELFSLPWKNGVLDDIAHGHFVFFVTWGKVEDNKGNIYISGKRLLGVLPFLLQNYKKYKSEKKHQICYIETSKLADYYLKNPKAFQIFIRFEENFGSKILSKWRKFPRVRLIASEETCWESIHLALTLAHRQFEKTRKKTLIIEWQSSGLSLFDSLGVEVPLPITQYSENEVEASLEKFIEKRTLKLNDATDLLNAHFLSAWNVTKEKWPYLFWKIKDRYNEIIIHAGCQNLNFIIEQCDTIFSVRTSFRGSIDEICEKEKNQYVPTIEIFSGKRDVSSEERPFQYPLSLEDNQVHNLNNILPEKIPVEHKFWNWLTEIAGPYLDAKKSIVIGESAHNRFAISSFLNSLLLPYEKDKRTIRDYFNENLVVFQGLSAIAGFIAALENSWKSLPAVLNNFLKTNIFNNMKPVFPVDGFFSRAIIEKKILSIFGSVLQQKTTAVLSSYCQKLEQLRWYTSGSLADNLLSGMFPRGTFNTVEKKKKTENISINCSDYASSNKRTDLEFAMLARAGIEEIEFYYFSDENSNKNSLFEIFLSDGAVQNINLEGRLVDFFIVNEKNGLS
ncbi:MAG: hypothetical protein OEZ13_12280 [Spirochaetia bacterium]|nr:hypothetical protein [Spirochaetia bacterium]